MGVTWRALEDLAAFNQAISTRFKFKTLALFGTDRRTEAASRFVRQEFSFIDQLTGPEVLAVTLAEPKGGYWRYLREERSDGGLPADSIHAMLDDANRRASSKPDISRESLNYREGDAPPTTEHLTNVLSRLGLQQLRPPFIALFDIPSENRSVWAADMYAAIALPDTIYAEPSLAKSMLEILFAQLYGLHRQARGQRSYDALSAIGLPIPLNDSRRERTLILLDLPRVAFGHFVAVFNSRTDQDVKVLVNLHGINTRGEWQKAMAPWIAAEGWIPYPVDYGRYGITRFLLTRHVPSRIQLKFRHAIENIRTDARYKKYRDNISVIAHSFGTQVVTETFETYQHLMSFDKFIFCGSVVPSNYEWERQFSAKRLRGLLNEFGTRDIWTRVDSWVRRREAAGVVGFSDPNVENYERHVTHSDWFNLLQFDRVWVPFLKR